MRSVYLTALFLLLSYFGFGQKFQIPDSLKTRSFEEIERLQNINYRDSVKFVFYSKVFLSKAKQENNTLALAKGYRALSFSHTNDVVVRLQYLDSSIAISENLKDIRYPAVSYSNRADVYDQIKDYNKALDDYLEALKYSKNSNNKDFYYLTKYNIGLLKKKIGENEDAARVFKDVLMYENEKDIDDSGHLLTMLVLAEVYIQLKLHDSATYYNRKGIERSIKDNTDVYDFFVLNEGINLFGKQQYDSSLDSIKKAIPIVESFEPTDHELLISGYVCLSKLYKEFNEEEKLLETLFKINKYYEDVGYTSIEMREAYEMLINYYRDIDNKKEQLYYIDKLFLVDSILDINYKDLSKKIVKEYDTPRLLEEKQNLIDALAQKGKKSNLKLSIALILILVLIIFVILIYIKNIRYKKRFQELMSVQKPERARRTLADVKHSKTPGAIGISEDVINSILTGLQKFENKNEFLSSNITTGGLAKQLKTNSKYLSKIINTYKEKSFSVYINELRIEYVIDKLKNDAKFRLYTIKAISREIGFNTTEAFSKSFYKKTGIYPSYFIKQLDKEMSLNV
ncbi:AraC family transcriptional regulator [Aquimarina algiphila]|uniref:AraC family transcriptional regulator n=1 Tax=Aquimarina algiphila TaxID=2047982 RepID=UPI0024927487|nr:AraC family transcriptional regulator [Aquimarina algiphila]